MCPCSITALKKGKIILFCVSYILKLKDELNKEHRCIRDFFIFFCCKSPGFRYLSDDGLYIRC